MTEMTFIIIAIGGSKSPLNGKPFQSQGSFSMKRADDGSRIGEITLKNTEHTFSIQIAKGNPETTIHIAIRVN